MPALPIHTAETAPEQARPLLEKTKQAIGRIPNLYGIMAESPALLAGYQGLLAQFEQAGFSAAERQVVYLAAVIDNGCEYCVAAHSFAARRVLAPDVLAALREGRPLPDAKLEALRAYTIAVSSKRGWVSEADKAAFLTAGYTPSHMLGVIVGVSLKVMTTYTNHLAETPLDPYMKEWEWHDPQRSAAE